MTEPSGLIDMMMGEAMRKNPALAQLGIKPMLNPDKTHLVVEMTAAELKKVIAQSSPNLAFMELELHEGKAMIKFKL